MGLSNALPLDDSPVVGPLYEETLSFLCFIVAVDVIAISLVKAWFHGSSD